MHFQTDKLLREVSKIPQVQQMYASPASNIESAAIVELPSFLGGALGGALGGVLGGALGGALGGRMGCAIGGAVGTIIANSIVSQNLQPVSYVIRTMLFECKVKLASEIRKLAKKHANTIRDFIRKLSNNSYILQGLLEIITSFFVTQLNMYMPQLAY